MPNKVSSFCSSEKCSKIQQSDVKSSKSTDDFKNSMTQRSTSLPHAINKEQYLGIDTDTENVMKTKKTNDQP